MTFAEFVAGAVLLGLAGLVGFATIGLLWAACRGAWPDDGPAGP